MSISLSSQTRILFIDDDADVQRAAALLFQRYGLTLFSARTPDEAWSVLGEGAIDVVLLDLNFRPGQTSGAEGLQCLGELLAHDPDLAVVVVTGHSGVNIAVAAMRMGATNFVMKPWNNDRLVATLNDAVAIRRQRREARRVDRQSGPATMETTPIIADTVVMRRQLDIMRRAAATDAAILLIGEAGTGKSLLAETIHRLSSRAVRSGIRIGAAAATDPGFQRAFAEALDRTDPEATLFLDEVDGLLPAMQSELLAFLESRPHIRLVAATRVPREILRSGALQPDLLYRLDTVELCLPPLRERREDIRILSEYFLRRFARRYGRPELALSPEAIAAMTACAWPGNVRALQQALERAVVLAPGKTLGAEDIPLEASLAGDVAVPPPGQGDLNLARSERAVVEAALRRHGFNVSHAARELGVTRASLYRRMARHGL